MSEVINAPVEAGNSIELPPPAQYLLYCYSLIIIGEIPGFQDKYQNKMIFIFELPSVKAIFNEAKGPQPFATHRIFTLSLHKQSNLRPFVEQWQGKKLDDATAETFNIAKLVDIPAIAFLIHNETKTTNKTYLDIQSIAPAIGVKELPPRSNPKMIWTWGGVFDVNKFLLIPMWIRNMMIKSKEFANLGIPVPVGEGEMFDQTQMKVVRIPQADQAQMAQAQNQIQQPPVQQQPVQQQSPVQQVSNVPVQQQQPVQGSEEDIWKIPE